LGNALGDLFKNSSGHPARHDNLSTLSVHRGRGFELRSSDSRDEKVAEKNTYKTFLPISEPFQGKKVFLLSLFCSFYWQT
jgi:hypothetical protein